MELLWLDHMRADTGQRRPSNLGPNELIPAF